MITSQNKLNFTIALSSITPSPIIHILTPARTLNKKIRWFLLINEGDLLLPKAPVRPLAMLHLQPALPLLLAIACELAGYRSCQSTGCYARRSIIQLISAPLTSLSYAHIARGFVLPLICFRSRQDDLASHISRLSISADCSLAGDSTPTTDSWLPLLLLNSTSTLLFNGHALADSWLVL